MAHVLRKVDKDFSFDEQRVELNELALDVYNLKHDFDGLSLDDLVDVNAAGANIQQIIKFDGTSWVLDTDVLSSSFSIITAAASGGGALSYSSANGTFTYTPPDLGGFLTSLGSVGGHTDVDVTGAVTGKILKYNGTSWVVADDNTAVASAFVSLTDTPNSFTAGKWLKVNAGGTALEWTDAPQTALSSINDINDVTITNAQGDQLLKWDGSKWVNFTPSYLTSFTETDPNVPTHVKNITQANITAWNAKSDVDALNDLSDVDTTGAADTKILKHNGTKWVVANDGGSVQSDWQQSTTSADDFIKNKPTLVTSLNGLSDVDTTGAANTKILKYNGTNWVVADDATGAGGSGGASVTISDTAPASPTAGDLWFKSDEGRLKIYYNDGDSTQWVDTSPIGTGGGGGSFSVTTDDNEPSNPSDGDLWWKSDEGQLKVYYQDVNSSQWVDTGGGTLNENPKIAKYLGEVELWNFGNGITWRGTSGITASIQTAEGGGGFQEAYVRLAFAQSYTSANDYAVQITVTDPSTTGHIYAPSIRKHLNRVDFNVQNLTSSVLATGWRASVAIHSL